MLCCLQYFEPFFPFSIAVNRYMQNSVDPDEMLIMHHFIMICTALLR